MHTRRQKVDRKISLSKELGVYYFQLIVKAWFQGKTCLLHKNKDKSVEDNLMRYDLPRISGFTFDFHKKYSNQVIYSRKSFSLQE